MNKKIPGLRNFLLTLLKLINKGTEISVLEIEELLKKGVATSLFKEYSSEFEDSGFSSVFCREVDEYYKTQIGLTDDCERNYGIDRNHGISLLIALSLNMLP